MTKEIHVCYNIEKVVNTSFFSEGIVYYNYYINSCMHNHDI